MVRYTEGRRQERTTEVVRRAWPVGTMTKKPWTAEELVRLPEGWRYEIDEGELVIMAPAGWLHDRMMARVAALLASFVRAQGLGHVVAGESGVFLRRDPDILRAPDVAYYSPERAARIGDPVGFADVPPDLAVEIHDPSERDVKRKVQQYLEAGVKAVWVVDPQARTLTRYAPGGPPRLSARLEDVIEEPVLPGFRCELRELFGDE